MDKICVQMSDHNVAYERISLYEYIGAGNLSVWNVTAALIDSNIR